MSRPNPIFLTAFLAATLALLAGISLLKGGLYIAKHEGDTLHLLDIVFRMADGEWPHLDFSTPIGILAFQPVALLVRAGLGAGHALLYAQALFGLVMLPAIVWACWSRLSGLLAWFVGFYLIVLCVALTYGDVEVSTSMSMHYNRWSWVLVYIALILSILPAHDKHGPSLTDGVIIGVAMALLALTKVTFLLAFAGPVIIGLLTQRGARALLAAVLAGLVVAMMVTVAAGPNFWLAYLADLQTVANSPLRTEPGQSLGNLLGAPQFLGMNLILLTAIIFLRQGGQERGGLLLLLLMPGFVYVTWQNYGNDPQWLILLAAVLLTLRPAADMRNGFGWPLRQATAVLTGAVLAIAAPSFFNLIYSPFRHFGVDTSTYVPLLPRATLHADLQLPRVRAERLDAQIGMDGEGSGLEQFREGAERKYLTEFQGRELPVCEVSLGIGAWYDTVSSDLQEAGFANKRIYEADLFDAIWLYGPFPRLKHASPWYYGGNPGLDDADYVMIPECAMALESRYEKVKALVATGEVLVEVRATSLYRLYLRQK